MPRRRRLWLRRAAWVLPLLAILVVSGIVGYREAYPEERPDLQVLPTVEQRVEGDLRQRIVAPRELLVTGRSGQLRFGFLVRNLQEEPLRLRAAPGWAADLERRGIQVQVGWSPPRRDADSFDTSLGPLAPRDGIGFVVASYRITCVKRPDRVDLTPRFEVGLGVRAFHAPTRSARGRTPRLEDARIVPLEVEDIGEVRLRRGRC